MLTELSQLLFDCRDAFVETADQFHWEPFPGSGAERAAADLQRRCVTAGSYAADARRGSSPRRASPSYADRMLDLDRIDVDEIATALVDQTDYEHRWLI
jgi:hypothetical protein